MRQGVVCVVASLLTVLGSLPATAQDDAVVSVYDEVTLRPVDGTVIEWNGKQFAGEMQVRAVDGELVLIESLGIDEYLLGIQEVPFSWEDEALRAQAVAARTYLAWTLSLGRRGSAETYGFDICATDQCQVYGGVGQVAGPDGARWAAAVEDTAAEVLLYNGRPAQALYSSTSGGRTRDVRDVFESNGVPYLQAVPSPDETSPFVEWTVTLTGTQFERVLRDAELVEGRLVDVEVTKTADGAGPWRVDVSSSGTSAEVSTWQFRREMNASGARVLPDILPAERPDGNRYPQTILSPTFDIERTWDIGRDFTSGYIPATPVYDITGNGWGHLVGMSQYGAQAMAENGAGYEEILAHYYGGLTPEPDTSALPDVVDVGLAWGVSTLELSADGPVDVLGDAELLAGEADGTWQFGAEGGLVVLGPADGRPLPPVVRSVEPRSTHPSGVAIRVSGELSVEAEARLTIFRGPEIVAQTDWELRESGPTSFVWDATIDGRIVGPGTYRAVVSVRNEAGSGAAITSIVITP